MTGSDVGIPRLARSGSTSRSSAVGDVLGILLGIALVQALGLLLKVLLAELGSLVPGVVLRSLVQLRQVLIVGADATSSVAGGITSHITEQNGGVLEELAELSVGDEQRSKGS